jgi:hypothetical protein
VSATILTAILLREQALIASKNKNTAQYDMKYFKRIIDDYLTAQQHHQNINYWNNSQLK